MISIHHIQSVTQTCTHAEINLYAGCKYRTLNDLLSSKPTAMIKEEVRVGGLHMGI